MKTATVEDIQNETPEHGTLVVLNDGTEVVFAVFPLPNACYGCIFKEHEYSAMCRTVRCNTSSPPLCRPGGVYVPKLRYMQLKLLGEAT